MTNHSKGFSRRKALLFIGAAAVAIIVGEQPSVQAKKRGRRSSKPNIQPQPPSQVPSSGGANRPTINRYPSGTATCDTVRYPNCNTSSTNEDFFIPLPVFLLIGILLGGGWLLENREKVANFINEVNETAEKEAAQKQQQVAKKSAQTTNKVAKLKPKKPQSPVDPIEVELNQLSAEFGMTTMRPVRKTTKSQQVLWEVFRSEAIGPYTKEQLRSEQQITARTNVRRVGETDWMRAGEIPELANFLTLKS